jgi:hypothetical protein
MRSTSPSRPRSFARFARTQGRPSG